MATRTRSVSEQLFAPVALVVFYALFTNAGSLRAADPGPTVTVKVVASDINGNPLSYHWRATDGQIQDVNAPMTTWTLPSGPGIHFAYVLVSNGMGGYTERRLIVNTDGTNTSIPSATPRTLSPRPARDILGDPVPFRDWLGGGVAEYVLGGVLRTFKVALPGVAARGQVDNPAVTETASTSLRGDFTFQRLSPNGTIPQPFSLARCTLPSGSPVPRCFGNVNEKNLLDEVVDVQANQTNRITPIPSSNTANPIVWITGRVLLADGSPCGTENAFFGVTSTATAEVVDRALQTVPGTFVHANAWGQFSIPQRSSVPRTVIVRCEGAPPRQVGGAIQRTAPDGSLSLDVGLVRILGSRPPLVTGMSSTTPPGVTANFDRNSPPTGLPSDVVPLRSAKFLSMKGLDNRVSACAYYRAIGAVRTCDAQGNFQGAISFSDWKRFVRIDEFVAPQDTTQFSAFFVNVSDLNLTRHHEMISHGPHDTAGYVCNHVGPANPDSPANVDQAIDNAVAGKNLVACVAMDFTVSRGINNDQPFTRFYVFGPSGELLTSVNLDGLGEKFVPGTCVVCHGGNKYAGRFPADGTGRANIEGHFLPFDEQSFKFRSEGSFSQRAQEGIIFELNQNVREGTNATQAEVELIEGWYPNNVRSQNQNFVPASITTQVNRDFYQQVIAKSCRSCHIVQRDEDSIKDLNFATQGINLNKAGRVAPADLAELICGEREALSSQEVPGDLLRAYAMPNSLVTFNRFWRSDQPDKVATRIGLAAGCVNPNAPRQ